MAFTDGGDIVNKRQEIADSHGRLHSIAVFLHLQSKLKITPFSEQWSRPPHPAVISDEELLVTSSGFNFGVQREHLRTCRASCEEEEDKLAAAQ